MIWHIYPTIGSTDSFRPDPLRDDDNGLRIPIDSLGVPNEIRSNRTWDVLDSHRLRVQRVAVELYWLAVAVYSADIRIPRSSAFDKWTRDITLYIPASDVDLWQSKKGLIQEFLSFLTGDHWTVCIRYRNAHRPGTKVWKWRKGRSLGSNVTVSLFSGGLDSFIGAVDALSVNSKLALVGHYQEGLTKSIQARVFDCLSKNSSPGQLDFLQFYICPPKFLTGEEESSSRSRSFLFLALAVLVVSGLADNTKLLVPENGFISLNVPLTGTRLGSLSTRTTHPHTLYLFKRLIADLGLDISIETPYRFVTKGEMLNQAKDQTLVRSCARATFSCAHPAQGRWDKGDPGKHCGYCVPCLIRRAAMCKAGLDCPSDYTYDVLEAHPSGTRSADINAFLIALEHSKSSSSVSSVLQSGPLHATSSETRQYLGVYQRGLQEVADFLSMRTWKT